MVRKVDDLRAANLRNADIQQNTILSFSASVSADDAIEIIHIRPIMYIAYSRRTDPQGLTSLVF